MWSAVLLKTSKKTPSNPLQCLTRHLPLFILSNALFLFPDIYERYFKSIGRQDIQMGFATVENTPSGDGLQDGKGLGEAERYV